MRILKCAKTLDSRNTGMGRAMHRTADEMRALGHEVDLWFEDDVPRKRLGRLERLTFPIALVRKVQQAMAERGRYDVVEVHEPSAAWYCRQRRRGADLPPCVIISHGLEETQWRRRLELGRALGQPTSLKSRVMVPSTLLSQARYGIRHCQQVMCLNSDDIDFLRHQRSIPEEKITLYHNGVDADFFVPRQPRVAETPRLLFVGSWLQRKGREILTDAFARLKQRYPGLLLSIVGSGVPDAQVLAQFSEPVRGAVRVIRYANDQQLRDEYAGHDIFIFPSYHEPWGLTSMEAAAAGLAVVTTDSGGPRDLFTHRENALLVRAADAGAMIDAVTELIDHRELLNRLQRNAPGLARRYTWRAAAETQLHAYERAIRYAGSRSGRRLAGDALTTIPQTAFDSV